MCCVVVALLHWNTCLLCVTMLRKQPVLLGQNIVILKRNLRFVHSWHSCCPRDRFSSVHLSFLDVILKQLFGLNVLPQFPHHRVLACWQFCSGKNSRLSRRFLSEILLWEMLRLWHVWLHTRSILLLIQTDTCVYYVHVTSQRNREIRADWKLHIVSKFYCNLLFKYLTEFTVIH